MTLLLTFVSKKFTVQASDRRLTLPNGKIHEELANKSTMLCGIATFAYTGLAYASRVERTDELLLRCLAKPDTNIKELFDSLAKEAGRQIRNIPLQVPPTQRSLIRRTSFVGTGFVGLKNPKLAGRAPSSDKLHPFLTVISNAQGIDETWRAQADRDFKVSFTYLDEDRSFCLHAAGQSFTGLLRIRLERDIRRCLDRVNNPEPIARLLARAIRDISRSNKAVGPNVMCTMVRREMVASNKVEFSVGLIPLTQEVQEEARYFQRITQGPGGPAQWIYSPSNKNALVHYGPNYTCNGLQMKGFEFGPKS